jgi:hypothetical protein
MKRVTALAMLITASLLSPASAHTTLVSANPAVDSFVEAWPMSIELTFAEPLATIAGSTSNFITVTNAAAVELNYGENVFDGAKVTVPVKENLVPGPVLVSYRVSAQDGHVVEGQYAFNFRTTKPSVAAPSGDAEGSNEKGGRLLVTGATTLSVVLAMLFGIWAYRKRKS